MTESTVTIVVSALTIIVGFPLVYGLAVLTKTALTTGGGLIPSCELASALRRGDVKVEAQKILRDSRNSTRGSYTSCYDMETHQRVFPDPPIIFTDTVERLARELS